jgi:light-regulated signal transduction histidine kinase (bacteriophytochrome)
VADLLAPTQERLEELARQLEQRTAELRNARKDLENFNYSVSHDLRAPLRHISGYGQMILEDYGDGMDPQCRSYFERIREDAVKMGAMFDGLLKLSRLGSYKLCRQTISLGTLVEDVVREVSRDAAGRQVEWKTGLLPQVDCDAKVMKEVFSNLLGNALKFTRPAAQAVIETGAIGENGCVTFFVRDNGVGFDPKYADRLFTIFQRLHSPQDFEGHGVGLAIAQRIVHMHGGRIWAEAATGRGATFYFTLAEGAGR